MPIIDNKMDKKPNEISMLKLKLYYTTYTLTVPNDISKRRKW